MCCACVTCLGADVPRGVTCLGGWNAFSEAVACVPAKQVPVFQETHNSLNVMLSVWQPVDDSSMTLARQMEWTLQRKVGHLTEQSHHLVIAWRDVHAGQNCGAVHLVVLIMKA